MESIDSQTIQVIRGKKSRRRMYPGWRVVIAGTGVNFLFGVSYTWSIFAGGLSRQLGWSQTEAAFPYTVFIIVYALAMVIAGRMQDKLGPRRVILAGSFFLSSAFILSSLFLAPYGVALIWGLLYGIGVACCYGSVTPAALKWFPPQKKGLVTGIVVTGVGLSAFVMAPAVNLLVRQGIKQAFLLVGLVLLAGISLLSRLISEPPGTSEEIKEPEKTERWYTLLKLPQFYMLWVMFCFTSGTGITFVSHLNRIVEVHSAFEKGYIMVALFAFFNAAGRLAAGFLSDFIGRNRAMTLVFSITTLTLFSLLYIGSPVLLGLAISILGLTYGGLYSLFPAATVSYFGEANFGLNFGLIFTGLGAGGIFPVLAGYLFELKGDFSAAFVLLIAICLVATALSLTIKSPSAQEKAAFTGGKSPS